MHIERPTHCRTCDGVLTVRDERLEPISGLLISELFCEAGHGWIGSRWPPGATATTMDDDEGAEMNATVETTLAARTAERFAQIALAQLSESPHNPRTHFDETKLVELADSIRQKGIVEPLVVRQNPGPFGTRKDFEIVAGARRFRAAQLAGLETVPCIVRAYSDEDVLEIFVIENLRRDDLSPLEQARGFKQLLQTNADRFSVATIASKVGMSPAWVWDRIKLLDLVPEAQDLLEQGRITTGHAIVLARLKPADQERAIDLRNNALFTQTIRGLDFDGDRDLAEPESPYDDAKPVSIREFEAWVARHVRFDVEHAAKAQPLAFESLAEQVEQAQQTPGRGKKVIPITFEYQLHPDAKDESERTYGVQSWRRADGREDAPTCEHSVLGVVVAGPKQGSAFEVCIARDRCDTHFGAEIKAKKKAAKLRAKGDTTGATKVEKRQEQSWERQERERKERAALWNPLKPLIEAEAIRQVSKQTSLTPGQVKHFDDAHEIYINPREMRTVLGTKWHEQLAAALLVSEITGNYADCFDDFVEQVVKPLGLNLKEFQAVRDAHSPKPEAGAAAPKKKPGTNTRGRK